MLAGRHPLLLRAGVTTRTRIPQPRVGKIELDKRLIRVVHTPALWGIDQIPNVVWGRAVTPAQRRSRASKRAARSRKIMKRARKKTARAA